jgi:hypothetical protein
VARHAVDFQAIRNWRQRLFSPHRSAHGIVSASRKGAAMTGCIRSVGSPHDCQRNKSSTPSSNDHAFD